MGFFHGFKISRAIEGKALSVHRIIIGLGGGILGIRGFVTPEDPNDPPSLSSGVCDCLILG